MAGQEGVIKFSLDFERASCIEPNRIAVINGWRYVLYRLQLIGQDRERYQGYGFGNISVRESSDSDSFIITGTQTGGSQYLKTSDYSLVLSCDPMTNSIIARGETKPSSEAMTHGQVYQLNKAVKCVVHGHSPDIWRNASRLNLLSTGTDIDYGTPEMAEAVHQLFTETAVCEQKIFIMGGHEDGVVSFGSTLQEACELMIETLARAAMVVR